MTAHPCPSDAELAMHRDGLTIDPRVTAHVASCETCGARLQVLADTDTFVRTIATQLRSAQERNPSTCASDGAAGDNDTSTLEGFETIEEVGRGGQGVVYRALHRASGRIVAIKVMRLDSARSRARLEREARLAARLRHPNIVTMHDCGDMSDGRFAMAMEWIDGIPLDHWTRRVRADPACDIVARRAKLLRAFTSICDAVEHAHRNGVIHRDLKPENILVDSADEPRILDFGIATELTGALATRVTATGEVACTLSYAAPEQLMHDGHHAETRSDVYSLGVILFQLLTGRLPFESECGVADLLAQITHGAVPAPSLITQTANGAGHTVPIDRDLDTIVVKALARDPDRRYASAAALRDDIERYGRGDPIDARRDSVAYLARMALRRNRMAVGVGLAVTLALAAGGIAVIWSVLANRESSIREASERQRALDGARRNEAVTALISEVIPQGDTVPMAAYTSPAHRALNAISENLEAGVFGDDPLAVVATRLAIGDVSAARGGLRRAEVEYRQALRIVRERDAPDDVLTARAMTSLAHLLARRSSGTEAARLIDEALLLYTRLLGAGHADTLEALAVKAEVALAQGAIDAAADVLRELDARGDSAGMREAATHLLTHTYLAYGDAHDRLLPALTIYAQHATDPSERDAVSALVASLGASAVTLAEPAVLEQFNAVKRSVLGTEHPDLVESLGRLAQRYCEREAYGEALAPAEAAIRLAMPTGEPRTVGDVELLFLRFRASFTSLPHRVTPADIDALLAHMRRLLATTDPIHLITRLREMSRAHARRGDAERSRALYLEAIERAVTHSSNSPHVSWTKVEASLSELELKNPERGLALVDEAIEELRQADGSWGWHRSIAHIRRGELLTLSGRTAEARIALVEAERLLIECGLPDADRAPYLDLIATLMAELDAGERHER